MRRAEDLPRRSRRAGGRGRVVAAVLIAVILMVLLSLRQISTVYTDYLWFDSLEFGRVWSTLLKTKITLGVVFTLIFFVLMYANLAISDRLRQVLPMAAPEEELLLRYREMVAPRQRLVRIAVALVTAIASGAGASSRWNEWLLFRHGGSFGVTDPQFHRDVGFYVFKLPFLESVVDWAFGSLLVVLLLTAINHYLNGGIRLAPSASITRGATAHLSGVLGLLAIVKAAEYWLRRYELTTERRGFVQGVGYTDVNATLPALSLLMLIAVAAAVLLFANVRLQRWRLPIVAVALWGVIAIIAGVAFPAFVQRYRVETLESVREKDYIERNIAATRSALGLGSIVEKPFEYSENLTVQELDADPSTVENVRLLDPAVILKSFQILATKYDYYRFVDLDIDRYRLGDSERQVLIGVRELNQAGLPNDSWESKHLIYTHGYAVALVPVNSVTETGAPDFTLSDVPVEKVPGLELTKPQVYVGEGLNDYAIVATNRSETDPDGDRFNYDGAGGVRMGGFWRKAAFALRFGESDPLLSTFVTDSSRIMFRRDIREHVHELAPFLSFDADPYPVVLDGRVVFVMGAYTTTDNYPYAESIDLTGLSEASDLAATGGLNYVRNSVKAVVDSYTGAVTLYHTDTLTRGAPADPIAAAYDKAFPGLLRPSEEMPTELREHLRYPEDLFRVQTAAFTRYHIDDPGAFYERSDAWDIAQEPSKDPSLKSDSTVSGTAPARRIDPYYMQMQLPGATSSDFLLFRPFVPYSKGGSEQRQNLAAFMVAKSDVDDYGTLEVYRMTQADGTASGSVPGPLTVDGRIRNNTEISESITLLGESGSEVILGNMLIIPVGRSLLYLRPFYVQSSQDNSAPELRFVVASDGVKAVRGGSLEEALAQFPGADDALDGGAGTPSSTAGSPDETVAEAIARAQKLLDEAGAALREQGTDGLEVYQQKMAEMQDLVSSLLESMGVDRSADGADSPADASADSTTTTSAPAG